MTRLLLTGVGGFIGHHVAQWILARTDWEILGVDTWHWRHRGDRARIGQELLPYVKEGRLKLFKADLSVPLSERTENLLLSRELSLGKAIEKPIDYIINMASDSHVTRSIHDPESCWMNNCALILHMLEFARRVRPKKFIQISTDEVYGEASWDAEKGHPEWDTILPSNPYSASKAAQEALAISYWRTYGVPVCITNTMNVIGERQEPEKFLPMVIQKVMYDEPVDIHADSPERIARRVFLDVKNMADALLFLLQETADYPAYQEGKGAKRPMRVNICGDREMTVLEMAQMAALMLGRELKYQLVKGDSVRPGYDRRYALDGSLLASMGWKPPYSFEQTLRRIILWTSGHPEWLIRSRSLA